MNLPEPYASAPTPRTDVKIVKFTAISNRQGLARREYEGAEIDYVSPESMRQLERENLWLREVVEKLHKALDSDALWTITGDNVPLELTGIYANGGSLTLGSTSCAKGHAQIKQALSDYTQLQEYLKVQDVKTNN